METTRAKKIAPRIARLRELAAKRSAPAAFSREPSDAGPAEASSSHAPAVRSDDRIPAASAHSLFIGGHTCYAKKKEDQRPQEKAFQVGDLAGHTTFIRFQLFGSTRDRHQTEYAYTSFADNAAAVKFLRESLADKDTQIMSEGVYELLRTNRATPFVARLHFDCEWYDPQMDPEKSDDYMAKLLATLAKILLVEHFCTIKPRIAITDNSRAEKGEYKNSFHIIVTNVYAESHRFDDIAQKLAADMLLIRDNGHGGSPVDLSIYSRNRLFRLTRCSKGPQGPPMKIYYFARPPTCVEMAFKDPANPPSFEEELLTIMVAWPRTSLSSDDFLIPESYNKKDRVAAGKPTGAMRKKDFKVPVRAMSAKERYVRKEIVIKIHAPDDMMSQGELLATWVSTSTKGQQYGWNKSGALEFLKKTDRSNMFTYTIDGTDRAFVCPAMVHHSGNSQKKILLCIDYAGDISNKCFRSSCTDGTGCLRFKVVGNIHAFTTNPPVTGLEKYKTLNDMAALVFGESDSPVVAPKLIKGTSAEKQAAKRAEKKARTEK